MDFEAKRADARFHSATCRKRANRASKRPLAVAPAPRPVPASVADPEPPKPVMRPAPEPVESEFERATRIELERVGQAESIRGQQVLIIARRMAGGGETGSALVALSKEHTRLMAEVGAGQQQQADPLDEVSRRRDAKLGRASAG